MQEVGIETLRADCKLAAKFWGRIYVGLSAMAYREKGEEAIKRFWQLELRHHQSGYYLEGLRKLGIRDEEPPAVKAAKYHYLSNQIGGLSLEYIEESPKKVWIRYTAPMWAFPGVALMAIPGTVRRAAFNAWHPRNGALMGVPRLGWVSTKFIMENEPCDEGYFIEYDRDLRPGEEFRFEPASHTPEFDQSKAPKLDPVAWPEARRLKADRKFSREHVKTAVNALYEMFGQQVTYFLLHQVMRSMAIQYTHEFKQTMGIEGSDAKAIAKFLYKLQRACGQDVNMTYEKGVHRIQLRSHLPFSADVSEQLRAAVFEFPLMVARLLNGRVAVTRVLDGPIETWEVVDAGRWLW
ncbi:hypothetical protein [Bradyrhizobium sp. 145]|uniref:hypothetical protein n=1 Tax=Bradyrhizobium sp. 145 TaxID=2782621 RepID=UPI001FFB7AE6|nr:hypothetical protein [Bradyrhizobium sp. 145]MCK1688601.1 hypothetical protein [Bradyrhizobium sp. 145]